MWTKVPRFSGYSSALRSFDKRKDYHVFRCYSVREGTEPVSNEEDHSFSSIQKYNADVVESRWYEWWESQGYFKPKKLSQKHFTVILPPPNITGTLHLGHALTVTIQDALLRWRRMKGESVLWIPGTDHAGIATQAVVEKSLKKEHSLSKFDLGREEFIKKIWEWKQDKGDTIIKQLRMMGASLDWSKQMFTLDPSHSKAVTEAFIRLYETGLIYRANSLINWSCALQSSISDIEVDWQEIDKPTMIHVPGYDNPIEFGTLNSFAYKINDEGSEIIVSTTRPETMLGDVAIAVHPDDERYTHLHRKFAWHPFRNCQIPILADPLVDPKFGTGAVKITPAHDVTDLEIGNKHCLEPISVITESGEICSVGDEKFHGLKRYDARRIVLEELDHLGLLREKLDHPMRIPLCNRSGDVVEFLLKPQWFVNCQELRIKAMEVVKNGQLKIEPDFCIKHWFHFLESGKDWNVSRQLWWGHQIPMFECFGGGESVWIAAHDSEGAKLKASKMLKVPVNEVNAVQDEDVLDTWFSSALLPFSSLGWPNCGEEYSQSYPLGLMETGHDILFFWVARMVMLGMQLTGQLPFNHAILHGVICDAQGKKMSKSLGNVISPESVIFGASLNDLNKQAEQNFQKGLLTKIELDRTLTIQKKMFPNGIRKCGADALRYTLCSQNFLNRDVNFSITDCEANNRFCNKIWQGLKFFMMSYERESQPLSCSLLQERMNLFDRWILCSLFVAVQQIDQAFSKEQLYYATSNIRKFLYDNLFDIYLEGMKPILWGDDEARRRDTISVLFNCLETSLRLLSPFMPYLSEFLYQSLPKMEGFHPAKSIMIAPYPRTEEWSSWHNEELGDRVSRIISIVDVVRRVKTFYVLPGSGQSVLISCHNEEELHNKEVQSVICKLANVSHVSLTDGEVEDNTALKEEVTDDCVIHIVHGLDKETLRSRLVSSWKREEKFKREAEKLEKKMADESYQLEASAEEVKRDSKKLNALKRDVKRITETREFVDRMS